MRVLRWPFGRKANISLENKIMLYKTIMKIICSYYIEARGCASRSSFAIIQSVWCQILRVIVDSSWYITNQVIHVDFCVPTLQEVIRERSSKHHHGLETYDNPLLQQLASERYSRSLRGRWPSDYNGKENRVFPSCIRNYATKFSFKGIFDLHQKGVIYNSA